MCLRVILPEGPGSWGIYTPPPSMHRLMAAGQKGERINSPALLACSTPTARKKTNLCKKMKMLAARSWADEVGQMIKSEAHRQQLLLPRCK